MDYKYIEQLLKRYWQCETSLEEEQILRAFFFQKDVPAHLADYAPLFAAQRQASELHTSADFDKRLDAALSAASGKARPVRHHIHLAQLRRRLAPMLQAAAIVAVCLTIGEAAEHALNAQQADKPSSAIVESTYVRSENVAEILAPAQQRTEATAATQPNSPDTLTHSATLKTEKATE